MQEKQNRNSGTEWPNTSGTPRQKETPQSQFTLISPAVQHKHAFPDHTHTPIHPRKWHVYGKASRTRKVLDISDPYAETIGSKCVWLNGCNLQSFSYLKTLFVKKYFFSIKRLYAHLEYICNIFAKHWKDPMKALRGVDFTKYVLSVIIRTSFFKNNKEA